ncbi:MAG: short-chain fatty acyl-CoA regulator family protein, partial [Ketobacteraceae bacterium]|nr:short-chain fatty acyl-CoA regulator family protein [Ketobacteraceae bacterium]
LTLSKLLSVRQRVFQIAHQICLLEHKPILDRIIHAANFANPDSGGVARVGLANYFAGALLMPYDTFLLKAEQERYDIERLQIIFNVSFEQVCHRLSTLQRPGRTGIPFYFLRVDAAGNISKRQSASSFHFARVGGACPLWNVHEAFAQPGRILRQVAQMPDGKTYFCIARTVSRTEGGFMVPQKNFAVALGCEIQHAGKLVYSVGIDINDPEAAVPIGVSCRVCERPNCPQRAFPPIGKPIQVNENEREFLPYRFST